MSTCKTPRVRRHESDLRADRIVFISVGGLMKSLASTFMALLIISQMRDLQNQLRAAAGVEGLTISSLRIENSPAVLEMLHNHLLQSIEAPGTVADTSLTTSAVNSNEKAYPWAPTIGTSEVTQ